MNFRWGRKGYLASVIFRTFEHVHGITDLPKPIRHPAVGGRDVNVAWAIDTLTVRQRSSPSSSAYFPGRKRAMTLQINVAPNDARELVTVLPFDPLCQ
jgi:hypothetical protein